MCRQRDVPGTLIKKSFFEDVLPLIQKSSSVLKPKGEESQVFKPQRVLSPLKMAV